MLFRSPWGLSVLAQVTSIFTGISISPGALLRQCPNHYAFRARRLGIRVRGKENPKELYFAHTLNNTVVAPPRMLIAFLENNLREDGSVAIPKPLQPYMGGMTEIRRK